MGTTEYNFISNFYKSFSGTDTLVFILLPGSKPVILGSITTVSYSVYRTKQPVINLGRTNINGVTRGSRIFAGTMIFTLINQHWLNELIDEQSEGSNWLSQYDNIKADELPLFDLMIVSANEYGSAVSMFIYGADITDEGQVVSVEDLFTENTLSFVARDIEVFKAFKVNGTAVETHYSSDDKIINNVEFNGVQIIDNDELSKKPEGEEYIKSLEQKYVNKIVKQKETLKEKTKLKNHIRDLQYDPVCLMVGDDVGYVQEKLHELGYIDTVNYMYDKNTEDAIKEFQSSMGLKNITGVVDSSTYLALYNNSNTNTEITGIVINESGSRVYTHPNIQSSIVDTKPYNNILEIYDKVEEIIFTDASTGQTLYESGNTFYKIKEGYVNTNDVFSYEYSNKDIAFPTISRDENGSYVLTLQNLLKELGLTDFTPGIYDDKTREFVTKIQTENDIACELGIVNEETWRVIQVLTGKLMTNITNNNVVIQSQNAQGKYDLTSFDLNTQLFKGFDLNVYSERPATIKCCAMAFFADNNAPKIMVKHYNIQPQQQQIIEFSNFQELFVYDAGRGYPNKIEYIAYLSSGDTNKWIINYRGE